MSSRPGSKAAKATEVKVWRPRETPGGQAAKHAAAKAPQEEAATPLQARQLNFDGLPEAEVVVRSFPAAAKLNKARKTQPLSADSQMHTIWSLVVEHMTKEASQDLISGFTSPISVARQLICLSQTCKALKNAALDDGMLALASKVPRMAWEHFGVKSVNGMLPAIYKTKDWHLCTVPELQGILRTLHLKVSGRKTELVSRVRGFLEIDRTGPIPAELLFCLKFEQECRCVDPWIMRRLLNCLGAWTGREVTLDTKFGVWDYTFPWKKWQDVDYWFEHVNLSEGRRAEKRKEKWPSYFHARLLLESC